MADYYMLAGIVYQAPDLCSVFNSRLVGMTVLFSCYYQKKKILNSSPESILDLIFRAWTPL